ncbi:hypothetical protein sos41_01940 [Alphaproteobacteria bacterium SO-S41]|nr:hypothetical protein sos41_01940 [Alphaproteobacteria bacterium SO-S41]
MIATDTSSLSAYFGGQKGRDVDLVHDHMAAGSLILPHVVLAEALSAPDITPALMAIISAFQRATISDGYWERCGAARRLLRTKGLRARLGDALIAQACLDNDLPLVTRDADFRHYAAHCGLKLA